MVLHLHTRTLESVTAKSEWTNVHSLERSLPREDINVEPSRPELREKLGGTPKLGIETFLNCTTHTVFRLI